MSRRFLLGLLSCFLPTFVWAKALPLQDLHLPPGFSIQLYATGVKDARELALGDNGEVYVGSTDAGKVYAIDPGDSYSGLHKVRVVASGLYQPTGVAFYQGDLYVSEVDRIIKYDHMDEQLAHLPAQAPILVTKALPYQKDTGSGERYLRHGWKFIRFSPEGQLFIAVGSPCDNCISKDSRFGTIMEMKPMDAEPKIYATGVRNSVGFDWDPLTQKFWFTDNGRDKLGDNIPPDKLLYDPVPGLNFGFPYYLGLDANGKPMPDPTYGHLRSPKGITWPALQLPAHVAILGMSFYTGKMFPPTYDNQIIAAEHGSWDRSTKVGYQLILIKINGDKALGWQPFVTGWEKNERYWGRPVADIVLPDGSLLVSDDYAGVVYRISYKASQG